MVIGLIAFSVEGPSVREGEAPAEPRSTFDETTSTDAEELAASESVALGDDSFANKEAKPNVEWNATSNELRSFDDDLGPFEIRTRQLWDKEPLIDTN